MKSFSIALFKFSFILLVIAYIVFQYLLQDYYFHGYPFVHAFIALLTFASFAFLYPVRGNSKTFMQRYMLTSIIKMLSCLTAIVVYALVERETISHLAFSFISLYLSYLFFEVKALKKYAPIIKK